MGVAFDNTRVLWQPLTHGDAGGSCLFCDSKALSINLVMLLSSVLCISLAATIIANVMYRPIEILLLEAEETEANGDIDDGIRKAK
jgi:hypothetical protein